MDYDNPQYHHEVLLHYPPHRSFSTKFHQRATTSEVGTSTLAVLRQDLRVDLSVDLGFIECGIPWHAMVYS